MPKLEFTPDELKQYFNPTNRREHYYAGRSRDQEIDMRVHADGAYPVKLIDERRPNEPEAVQIYRKKIFVPKTKPYFNKIESTLQKIRRSSDWSIRYPDDSFDKVVEGEKMNDYAEHNYPIFGSVTNWAFSLLLRNYLIDANCVVIVAPLEIPTLENEYLKPSAIIFNSCDVIDFAEGDYCVLRNRVGCVYYSESRAIAGESYYVITTQSIYRYDQLNGRRAFGIKYQYDHMLEELPAFKVGGIVIDVYGSHSLYESRISGILPEFNEALREYSDLQAAKVLHLYPERWEYTNNECTHCKGNGTIPGIKDGAQCQVTCNTCQGQGYVGASPYSKIMIKPNATNMGDTSQIPTPPAGFVEKDVEIIKVQEQGVQDHIYNALASINFEFLAERPLATSGIKTAMDGDELNNTVHAIAEDLVRVIDKVYYLTAIYRYSTQYPVKEDIYNMLPLITVPEKFDILNSSFYDEQLKTAITNSYDPSIVNALQVSYATKAFNNDPKVAEFVALVLKLDPLAGIDEDTKMSRLSNNGITQLDYIVSSNINKFVHDAVDTKAGFLELDTVRQKTIIYAMATAQVAAQTALIADIPPDPIPPVNG